MVCEFYQETQYKDSIKVTKALKTANNPEAAFTWRKSIEDGVE